jgi:hypothetical protein
MPVIVRTFYKGMDFIRFHHQDITLLEDDFFVANLIVLMPLATR